MNLLFLLFFCVFAALLIKNIAQFIRNENSPVSTQAAVLETKRRRTSMDANHVSHTTFTAEFLLLPEQERLLCHVPRRVYQDLEEGGRGLLTHQGTRFLRFEWEGHVAEK